MGSPAERLLALLSLFQSRPLWTASELAERLGVTERTVRRDVSRLRDLGYPVEAAVGPTGGYQLGNGGSLPPLLLTDDEAVAVAVGLRAAASGALPGFEDSAVSGLAKLEQVLPVRLRDRVSALDATTVRLAAAGGPVIDADHLLTLAQGCRRPERMTFGYEDNAGRTTDRRVEPFRLVHTDRRWYLLARDLDRDDWRTFRVDRIDGPTLTGHRFVHTSEPDAALMVADGLAVGQYAVHADVLLRIDLAEAQSLVPRTVGSLEAADGGTMLRVGGDDLDWIARYLVGLGCEVEIVDPPELRTVLRKLAHRLLAAHPTARRRRATIGP
jgi:predicted DNA-binding transcriptional regulator YafY